MPDGPRYIATMESALAELVAMQRRPAPRMGDLFARATRAIADVLSVERASIWFVEGGDLRCQDLYRSSEQTHAGGMVLQLDQHGAYHAACRTQRMIAVPDVTDDPRLASLRTAYLDPLRIGALIDCPLFVGSELRGMLCVEHVDGRREWRSDERLFALYVGDLLSMALTSAEERDARRREKAGEDLYRSLVEDQTEFIVRARPDGRILFANLSLLQFIGLPLDAIRRTRILDHVPEADHSIVKRGLASLSPASPKIHYSHLVRRSGGECAMVEWRLRGFFDADGTPCRFQATGRDVTADRLREEQLRETHRLEAMALLAGGVVHDLNNILTPIAAYADLALATLPPKRPEVESMRKILAATERGHELARQVALFSRRERAGDRKPIAIQMFIEESLAILRPTAPPGITLQATLSGNLVLVAKPSDIYQILANLVGNAISYLPEGGLVEVRGERIGDTVQLEVVDEGLGIDASVQPSIFKPFFTTREASGGTGLGLAVVKGLVTELGGTIEVDSVQGRGTTFRMRFPAVPALPTAEVPEEVSAPMTSPHVLVVDDDQDIAEFMGMALHQMAYRVTTCTSPEEALATLRDQSFELMLTDLQMPGMDGLSLASAARGLHPDLPIVLVSGYCDLLTDEELHGVGVSGMLAKPFTLRQLGDAMGRALA